MKSAVASLLVFFFTGTASAVDCNQSMGAVQFPSIKTVLAIHQRDITQFGGLQGVRAPESLESAVESVRGTWGGQDLFPSLFDKAAALAVHISESQPFFDGNKRTALDSALTLLAMNGYDVKPQAMELYEAMVGVANKSVTREQLAAIFAAVAQKSTIAAPAERVPASIENRRQAFAMRTSDRVRRDQSHVFEKLVHYDRR
jgi:death on curing protein